MKTLTASHRLLIFVTAFAMLAGSSLLAKAAENTQKVLATVNGVAISQKDFDLEFNRIKMQTANRGQSIDPLQAEAVKKQVVETLINREILYQKSRAEGIVVETSEVADQLEKIKQRISPAQSFDKTLSDMGISEKEFEHEISKAMMIQRLLEQNIYRQIDVSDKEMRIFYENNPQFFKTPQRVKASHILIKVNSQATEDQKQAALEKITQLREKLLQGQDFAELAKQFSEGPSSKNGGDLGFFDKNKMVKPFSDAAFSLEPGEISDVVETQFGYHIIKVFEKTPEEKLQFAEIKERLRQNLRHQKIQKETGVFIDRLKETADIERLPL